MTGISHAERLTAVEVRVQNLETKVDDLRGDVKALDTKMDALLALKNKGAGAFWLASALMGTSIVSSILAVIHYLFPAR